MAKIPAFACFLSLRGCISLREWFHIEIDYLTDVLAS